MNKKSRKKENAPDLSRAHDLAQSNFQPHRLVIVAVLSQTHPIPLVRTKRSSLMFQPELQRFTPLWPARANRNQHLQSVSWNRHRSSDPVFNILPLLIRNLLWATVQHQWFSFLVLHYTLLGCHRLRLWRPRLTPCYPPLVNGSVSIQSSSPLSPAPIGADYIGNIFEMQIKRPPD